MMKKSSLFCLLAAAMLFTSCIREEAANVECDITGVDASWIESMPAGFFLGEPNIQKNSVTFLVNESSDVTALAPRFSVSDGATLWLTNDKGEHTPFDPNLTRDFTEPKLYSVLSQNGYFSKDYIVSFYVPQPFEKCDFEEYAFDRDDQKNYHIILQKNADGTLMENTIWTSGNGGYKLTGMAKSAEEYPTVIMSSGGIGNSRCLRLMTCDAGNFGMKTIPKMPIAAGNAFIGTFNLNQAMLAPRKATRFGLQIVKKEPVKMKGWYKYTAGVQMTDKNKQPIDEKDMADIYAVLFEANVNGKFVPLDGDNILNSNRIVALARIDDPGEPQEWTWFEEPFKPMNGKTFDLEKAKNNEYAFTLVMSSSRKGAHFEGAIGSTLFVDDITIEWK